MPAAKNIDLSKLQKFLQLKPTKKAVADFFECSEKHIERVIKKEYGKTFFEFRDQQMDKTRHALVQKALSESLATRANTTMLIFCLKNLAGWSDKYEASSSVEISNITFEDDEE